MYIHNVYIYIYIERERDIHTHAATMPGPSNQVSMNNIKCQKKTNNNKKESLMRIPKLKI